MNKYTKIDFYHGSGEDFHNFDIEKSGSNFKQADDAFFFTTNTMFHKMGDQILEDAYSAGAYAKLGKNPSIYIVSLNIKKPLLIKDLVYFYDLDPKDPFDGCHPQDFYDQHNYSIKEIVKDHNYDAVVLDQSVLKDGSNEITAIVFDNSKIDFKYKKTKKQTNKNKIKRGI